MFHLCFNHSHSRYRARCADDPDLPGMDRRGRIERSPRLFQDVNLLYVVSESFS